MSRALTSTFRRLHPELAFFLAAYLLYIGARWVFAGDPAVARDHAAWIVGLERSLGVAVEAGVQRALDAPAVAWLLSAVYMAAQLVVLPGALVRAAPLGAAACTGACARR